MAEEVKQDETPAKGGSGKKSVIIIAALMLIEAAVVFAVVSVFAGGPSSASASDLAGTGEEDLDAPIEIQLLEARFQNMSTGRVWGWKTTIFIKVRQKNVDKVQAMMERDNAEIQQGISLIFRRAEDRQLREPDYATLTRQLNAYVHELFGEDADGAPLVDRVIITELRGAPEDI